MTSQVKKRVLLLDDCVVHRDDSVIESKLESFAERLRNKENFSCKAQAPVDDRGFPLKGKPIKEVAKTCRGWIDSFEAGGLVIDIDWWRDDRYGEKLWNELKHGGLALPKECIVFVSMFVSIQDRATIAFRNQLSPLQVNYKDTNGFNAAATWLKDHM